MLVSLVANFVAQVSKTIVNAIQIRRWDPRMLWSTGGMPSSHSATVTSVSTMVGIVDGWNSTTFAIAVTVACVVMYDAQGVRLAASRQAEVLNDITQELFDLHPQFKVARLKELLGHTPMQVIVGASLGVAIAFLFHYWVGLRA